MKRLVSLALATASLAASMQFAAPMPVKSNGKNKNWSELTKAERKRMLRANRKLKAAK